MSTSSKQFSINWTYIIFVAAIAAAGLGFIAFAITSQVYREWSRGLPISGGFNWSIVIVVDLVCFVTFLALLWKIYRDTNTDISDDDLAQPSLLGLRTIRWSEVTDVKVFGGIGYHVFAGRKKIVVTPYAYSGPKKVIATLFARIEGAKSAVHKSK